MVLLLLIPQPPRLVFPHFNIARSLPPALTPCLPQDLAVVVLLMLIPLLAPSPDGSSGGLAKIAQALGTAAVKAVLCIGGIVAGGRVLIQPLYKKVRERYRTHSQRWACVRVGGAGTGLLDLNSSITPAAPAPPALPHAPLPQSMPDTQMSEFANAEIFAATTLLVVLGTSFLTSLAGLSLALGAFLAGLLIAETDYVLQVRPGMGTGLC